MFDVHTVNVSMGKKGVWQDVKSSVHRQDRTSPRRAAPPSGEMYQGPFWFLSGAVFPLRVTEFQLVIPIYECAHLHTHGRCKLRGRTDRQTLYRYPVSPWAGGRGKESKAQFIHIYSWVADTDRGCVPGPKFLTNGSWAILFSNKVLIYMFVQTFHSVTIITLYTPVENWSFFFALTSHY